MREASNRRVDAAETLYHDLATFFKRAPSPQSETTEKKAKTDLNALLHGRHDGRLVVENIAPKLTRGKRKIIDETFKDTAQFKETVEDQITE